MALTRPKIWDLDTNIEYFQDPITVLHQGASSPNVDVGFLFNRANGLVPNVALYWSESLQSIVYAQTSSTGATNSNIVVTSYADVTAGSVKASNIYTTGLFWAANSQQYSGLVTFPAGSTGTIQFNNNGLLGAAPLRYFSSNGAIVANSTVNSVNTTTGAMQIAGGLGVAGSAFAGAVYSNSYFYANGSPIRTGISYTAASAPPASPNIGDQWYDENTDTIYEYLTDGVGTYWVDTQTPVYSAPSISSNITIANVNYAGVPGIINNLFVNNSLAVGNLTIGQFAGNLIQGANAVAIGTMAAQTGQGVAAISIGLLAGNLAQAGNSIAIGTTAGATSQLGNAVAIGGSAGTLNQGTNAVAVGNQAGAYNQGTNAVAIGNQAGVNSQTADSIVINASGTELDAANAGLYVNPVRHDTSSITNVVYYNTTTKEITYGPVMSMGGGYGGNAFVTSGTTPMTANIGDTWYDSSTDILYRYIYDGVSVNWIDESSTTAGLGSLYGANRTVTEFTATSGQTTFTTPYTVGYVDVYQNGVKLGSADYTATDGSNIVLTVGANAGSLIQVVALYVFTYLEILAQAANVGNIFSNGNITSTGNISTSGYLLGNINSHSNITTSQSFVGGNVYTGTVITNNGIYWANGALYSPSGKSTSSSTAPSNPGIGDIWYNTATDDIYRYTTDGTTSVWLDITGPSLLANTTSINFGNITTGNLYSSTANVGNIYLSGLYWSGNGNVVATGYGINYTVATSQPTVNVHLGDQWFNPTTNILYEYINDGVAGYWVDVSSQTTTVVPTAGNLSVVGNILPISPAGYDIGINIQPFRNVNAGTYYGNVYAYANGVSILTGIGGTYSNSNVASYLPVYSGNITANNLVLSGNLQVAGNITTVNYETVTYTETANVLTANTLTVSGNVNVNNGGEYLLNGNSFVYADPNQVVIVNNRTINSNVVLPANTGAVSVGPISLASGYTFSLGANCRYVIL